MPKGINGFWWYEKCKDKDTNKRITSYLKKHEEHEDILHSS